MSPKKPLLTVGLTALGLFGYATTRVAYSGDPVAPPGPPPAPALTPTHTVLLMTSGRLISGPITEEAGDYVVRQNGGAIRVPKSQVEATFESVDAVYRYKLAGVPDRDPDEHLKLARWCLSQNMPAEAKAQLKAVIALSPEAREARAMLAHLEASEARAARPRVDPGLVQARAEVPEPAGEGVAPGGESRPAEIDAAAIARARRDLGVSALPVVFDLPPAVAVKRAEQFARSVHPVLQAACARCHNERTQGAFQLIEVKPPRRPTAVALRANLDATLRLVDPANPARSELLSSALVPHGNGASKKPIFRGANDPGYQILAAWVNSLRANRSPDGVMPTRFAAGEPSGGDGFAVDRGTGPTASLPALPTADPAGSPRPTPLPSPEVLPPVRYIPGRGLVVERTPPSADEFPVSPMLGGPKPNLDNGAGPAARPGSPPSQSQAQPGAEAPVPTPLAGPLPALPPAESDKPKKPPLKLDPDLLQKALLNRNINR
jgi:hypothetical protein